MRATTSLRMESTKRKAVLSMIRVIDLVVAVIKGKSKVNQH